MPNTLAHMGIQALVSRSLLPRVGMGWVWLGCLLPDLPWIVQRVLTAMPLPMSVYDIRAYAIVQSALVFCLIGAAAAAMMAKRSWPVFAVLAIGSAAHLLLDALQTKWANGVVLFAPFDWTVLNVGLFWPEDWPTTLLTLLGAAVVIWGWFRWKDPSRLATGQRRPALAALLAICWVVGPVAFVPTVLASDAHFIGTLRNVDDRPGTPVAFDRAVVETTGPEHTTILVWTKERLTIAPALGAEARLISLHGQFTGQAALTVQDIHVHAPGIRDWMTYAGLLAMLAWWGRDWMRRPAD